MALSSSTVSAAIANLSISGLTIRDTNNIPEELDSRSCPVLFPDPENWLDETQAAEEDTFGTASSRYHVVHRGYNYIYIYKQVGDGRGIRSIYPGGSTLLDAIIEGILTLEVSGVDVESVNSSRFGVITDPGGKAFYGSFISVRIRERINA